MGRKKTKAERKKRKYAKLRTFWLSVPNKTKASPKRIKSSLFCFSLRMIILSIQVLLSHLFDKTKKQYEKNSWFLHFTFFFLLSLHFVWMFFFSFRLKSFLKTKTKTSSFKLSHSTNGFFFIWITTPVCVQIEKNTIWIFNLFALKL